MFVTVEVDPLNRWPALVSLTNAVVAEPRLTVRLRGVSIAARYFLRCGLRKRIRNCTIRQRQVRTLPTHLRQAAVEQNVGVQRVYRAAKVLHAALRPAGRRAAELH